MDNACSASLDLSSEDPPAAEVRRTSGHTGRLYCSLPAHSIGDHIVYREHDCESAELCRWPHERDDTPAYVAWTQSVENLLEMPMLQLQAMRGRNILKQVEALRARAPLSVLNAIKRNNDQLDDAMIRRELALLTGG